MIDATPEGQHMTLGVFADVIDFVKRNQLMMLMLSGGEPLEHPEFFKIMEMAQESELLLIILSNGMFLADDKLRKAVLDLGVMIQVTNDSRYYPQTINEVEHPLLGYEHQIHSITSLGRAKTNDIATSRLAPMCFNMRSIVRNTGDFASSIMALRSLGKMCTPSINIDGSISIGETVHCCRIGTVKSPLSELVANLRDIKECNKCGLEDNLDPPHRKAIGLGV